MSNTIMTAKNVFSDGLIMDLAPDATQASTLTNALNATIITMNGNEYSLQNDIGNGRVETAYLPEGYMPVGTCELGGIIYIASYNPLTNKSQIGCFPSPERNISSDEVGNSDVSLNWEDFNSTQSVKKVLIKRNLNPGDKFIVASSYLEENQNYLSDYGNTDHIHGGFPKIVKLHIVSIEDSGKITYLDDSVRWYDNYYIANYKKTTQEVDIDSYRSILSSGYSVFQSKVSGKLAILAELESITGFECAYSVYKDNEETSEEETNKEEETSKDLNYTNYKVYINFHWQTDNNDINPSNINISDISYTGPIPQQAGKIHTWYKDDKKWILSTDFDDSEHSIEVDKIEVDEPFLLPVTYFYQKDDTTTYGYQLGQGCSYDKYKSQYNFDKLIEAIKELQHTSWLKVNQVMTTGGLPDEEMYYVDLDSISYDKTSDEPTYYTSYTTSEGKAQKQELKPLQIPDTVINNYFKSSICKEIGSISIPTSQNLDGVEQALDLSNVVLHFKATPQMVWGNLNQYAQELDIDFSKINSGEIDLTQWRYFNGSDLCSLQLGLDCYVEEGKGIEEVVLEFCDNQGVAAAYHLQKDSYSGIFPISLMLNQTRLSTIDAQGNEIIHAGVVSSDGTVKLDENNKPQAYSDESDVTRYSNDAGTIYSNLLYLVRITIKYSSKDILGNYNQLDKSEYKTFYRWLWTNTLFNSYYTSVKDFDSLPVNLTLDVAATYSSNLDTKQVDYRNPTKEVGGQLAATVQYITGQVGAKLDVGLQETYNTFCLYDDTDVNTKQNIQIANYIGKTYIDSPTTNTYNNLEGQLQEVPELQPTVSDTYDTSKFGTVLLTDLGLGSSENANQELWEDSTNYKNQWKIDREDSTTEESETIDYYNYNSQVTEYTTTPYKTTLDKCFTYEIKFNVSICDFSKFYTSYINKTITGSLVQPLITTADDVADMGLSGNYYQTSGPYWSNQKSNGLGEGSGLIHDLPTTQWLKSDTEGGGWQMQSGTDYTKQSVYQDSNYQYWIPTDKGTPVLNPNTWQKLSDLDGSTLFTENYKIVSFNQRFHNYGLLNGYQLLTNYIAAKDILSLSEYVKSKLPYVNKNWSVAYDNINDGNIKNTDYYKNIEYNLDTSKFNNVSTGLVTYKGWEYGTIPIVSYTLKDPKGNVRFANIAADSVSRLQNALVLLFSNLYVLSGTSTSLQTIILKDVIYLSNYTSIYTVDMLYKAQFNKGDNINDYLLMCNSKYSKYLDQIITNNEPDTCNKTNTIIKAQGVLKNIPIQLRVPYYTPRDTLVDTDSSYILRKCRFSEDAAQYELVSGPLNENTLYIYNNGNMEQWRSKSPNLMGEYKTDDKNEIYLQAYNYDSLDNAYAENYGSAILLQDASQINFANTNAGGNFTYENGVLKFKTADNKEDNVRIITKNGGSLGADTQDDDQLLHVFNRKETLVPWMAVLNSNG